MITEPLEEVHDEQAEAAVSGRDYDVPPSFLYGADLLVAAIAFVVARYTSHSLQESLLVVVRAVPQWLGWAAGPGGSDSTRLEAFAWLPLVMLPSTLLTLQILGGYRDVLSQSRSRIVFVGLAAPFSGLSIAALVVVLIRSQEPLRAFMVLFAGVSAVGLIGHRLALRFYKDRRLDRGVYARNLVVIASPDTRRRLVAHFAEHVSTKLYRLYGYLDPDLPTAEPVTLFSDPSKPPLRRLGAVDDLGSLLVRRPIHGVIAVQSAGSDRWLRAAIERCEYFNVTLWLVPEPLLFWRPLELQTTFRNGSLRLPEIVIAPPNFNRGALFIKRLIDIVVSSTLLLLLSPIFLVIAVAIKLTTPSLPVFYPWRVIGYKGRPFTGYKFTTMFADADARRSELLHLNEMSGPVFKMKNDPRVTPLGRFLRKYSVNELPQLWSVLKGDMSLVGPRPAYRHELARYELWHKRKLCVQPGITCLWQVRGRNRIRNFDEWVRMDLEYIDNWSLWKDVVILARTAWAVVSGSGV